jgi:hypothetical protein
MMSRSSWLARAAFVGLLVLLTSCHRATAGTQYISLSNDGGTCKQNGSTGVVDVSADDKVVYQGAAAVSQFQVQFDTCPFASCPVTSANGSPVDMGKPNAGAAGKTFNYTGLTINNQPCNLPGPMGLRVRGGP